jgi:putative Holliday junction resolvase
LAAEPVVTTFTVLGFDFGERRIGVAVGQSVTATANALTTVSVRDRRPDWAALGELFATWRPERCVVGLPTHADGTAHALAPRIERFCRQIEGRFGTPVDTVDERLSSFEARSRGATALDAEAACVILETWFGVYFSASQK